jgi:NAD(P)H-hydrate repair Nnr-like enzyme with NAD(P)H-hydrate dehydratase domain
VTASDEFPGSALLGITAAMRTGVGMVRYLGPKRVADLVLLSRPETVLQDGRAQAWVVGSGVPVDDVEQSARIRKLVSEKNLIVVDAGALQIVDFTNCAAKCVLTPHAGEAAVLFTSLGHPTTRDEVEADPIKFALLIASLTNQLTVLKGNRTVIAQGTKTYQFDPAPAVLATAGTGDVLAGIIGAFLAANAESILSGDAELFNVVKAAINLQAKAAALASKDSTVVALDIAEAIGKVVSGISQP